MASIVDRISGFRNILTNKVGDEIMRYYSDPTSIDDHANLRSIYAESFYMEFGGLIEMEAVRETLIALAISTSVFTHMSYRIGESSQDVHDRVHVAKRCVEGQLSKFESLFLNVASAFKDSDSE